ncbi:MAG: S9 family peptidase [Bacteroidetes bacterium]|nr:S9 family peptidase [Bacteroidota bacterium]
MILRVVVFLISTLIALSGIAQKRPMTVMDMMEMKRLGAFSVSPDGRQVVYALGQVFFSENRIVNDLFLLNLETGKEERLTIGEGSNFQPVFHPDGKSVFFISTRTGSTQVFTLDLKEKSASQVTNFSMGVNSFLLNPTGTGLAFSSDVYPDCASDTCNQRLSALADQRKSTGKVFERLPYRVWDSFKNGLRSHVWYFDFQEKSYRDLTPGDYDTPPIDLGGAQDFSFSPDGRSFFFVKNEEPQVAWSTNNDVFYRPLSIESEVNLTEVNKANDNNPVVSPDGKWLAWLAMRRPGFEADRYEVMVRNLQSGESRSLTQNLDRSAGDLTWSPDGKFLYFTADNQGYRSLYRVDPAGRFTDLILEQVTMLHFEFAGTDRIVYSASKTTSPAELFELDLKKRKVKPLTSINEPVLSRVDLKEPDRLWFDGGDGIKNHTWVVLPPGYDKGKKYPLVYLVHGGPQGSWGDSWSYRWNPQAWAAQGYIVALPDPTGSTGYGQAFTDAISKDWGGRVFVDLMKGLDAVIASYPVDTTRMAAAGASYGGYMMNWFQGHTTRFKTLISHAGVYNLSAMYGTTEEVWFPHWEFGGAPWENPEMYKKWSPSEYVKNFKTPTLIIHGALDYRVPESQAFEYFTALQYMGVPSKFLYFPNENHWILKPHNSKQWHDTVFDWLAEYLK